MSQTIVVGVDGSGCSDCAVQRAIELASGLGDSLVFAYAVEPPHRNVGEERKAARSALEEIGRPMVEKAAAQAADAGVDAESVLVSSAPPRLWSRSRRSAMRA